MTKTFAALALATTLAACASGSPEPQQPSPTPADPQSVPAAGQVTSSGISPAMLEEAARADSVRASWTEADARFITDMIHHHAQALTMARMASSHGASSQLRVLSGRIINAQNDEIALMQAWLRERGLPVPDLAHMDHGPHGHHMDMAGMATPEQMQRLDAAHGEDFDRLFLQLMIQHHQGAITMVSELFSTPGAGLGDAIFKLASDINVDQETEVDRMQLMLREMLLGTDGL